MKPSAVFCGLLLMLAARMTGAQTLAPVQTVAQGPTLIWPDSIAFSRDGFMYFTADQLDRQAKRHCGKDLRKRPFLLFRQRVGSTPVMLK